MKNFGIYRIYLIASLVALTLGHVIYLYQPLQVRFELAVKLAYINGRLIEQPSDLVGYLKSMDNISKALGDATDIALFTDETGVNGSYDFQVQGAKGSDIVMLILARKYFGRESPKLESSDFLNRLAHNLEKRQNELLLAYESEEFQRQLKLQSSIKGGGLLLFSADTYRQRAEVMGNTDLRKRKLLTPWLCYIILLITVLGLTHLSLYFLCHFPKSVDK